MLLGVALLASAEAPGDEPLALTDLDRLCLESADGFDRYLDARAQIFIDPSLDRYLNGIAARLTSQEHFAAHVNIRVRVLRKGAENGLALANGSIYLTAGMIARMENEPQLASIIAHEIAHVHFRHMLIKYAEAAKGAKLVNVASVFTGLTLDNNFIYSSASSGYSRQREQECDLYALELMARAGYDPRAALDAWERLAFSFEHYVELEPMIFYRDHPQTKKRIEYMTAEVKQRYQNAGGERGDGNNAEYMDVTFAARHEACRRNVDRWGFRTARAFCYYSLEHKPDDPETLVAMGDVLRDWTRWDHRYSHLYLKGEPDSEPLLQRMVKEIEADEHNGMSYANARWYYERALEVDPSYTEAYLEIGRMDARRNQLGSAIEAYRKYLELSPDAWDAGLIRKKVEILEEFDEKEKKAKKTKKTKKADKDKVNK